jgi:glucan-binding YG repeat protein
MNPTIRRILPVFLILAIVAACAGGGWIWYDNNIDRSGWVEKDGVRFYQDFHADPWSGWLELEKTYYLREDGTPVTGWQTIDGVTYYFAPDGAMHTGWLEEGGKTYYMGGNGARVEGWLWLETDRYYLRDGILLTGWQSIDGETYHFSAKGVMDRGFTVVDEKTYYFDDGVLLTGEHIIDDWQYDFGEDGVMFTGWRQDGQEKSYFRPDGTQAFGWEVVDGTRYFFDDSGHLCLDRWIQDGEYRYYIFGNGTYATGPTVIDGRTHYFTPKGIEVILVNGINPLPKDLQQTFVNVVDYHDVDSRCYDALVRMLGDFEETVGAEYTFNSAYRTWAEQTAILEYRTLEHMRDYGMTFAEARAKALETVAIPDTSEHQLGLSVDLVGKTINDWLAEHCWEYGFILRYPEGKSHITGITNEPWHFRYVGTAVSMDMKDSGLCLEEYLGAEAVTREGINAVHGDKWHREEFYTVDEETIAKYTQPQETP